MKSESKRIREANFDIQKPIFILIQIVATSKCCVIRQHPIFFLLVHNKKVKTGVGILTDVPHQMPL